MELVPDIIAPAPWQLKGRGVVWCYQIPKAFNQRHGFLADFQRDSYFTGLGAVMYVDYQSSGVGPYQELLYLPGLFKINGRFTFSISKIYVSSYDSVWNGRQNWGIQKERALFEVHKKGKGGFHISVSQGDQPFFEAKVKTKGPKFTLYPWLFSWFRIMQQKGQHLLLTKPTLEGHAQWAITKRLTAEADFFPPVQQLRPLLTLSIRDFTMVFPEAQVLPFVP